MYDAEKERARKKRDYEWYKSIGRCVRCHKQPAEPGHIYCLACRMDINEHNRANWHKRKEKANEQNRERLRARREEAKASGVCVICLKRKAGEGRTTCKICSARINNRQREKRDGHRISDLGGCSKCGESRVVGYKLCPECLEKYRAMMLHARQFKTTNYFDRQCRHNWELGQI